MKKLAINSFLHRLVSDSVITKKSLAQLLEEARAQQVSFITHLMKKQIIDSFYLATLMAKEFNFTFIDLDKVDTFHLPIDLIEEKLLQKYQVLPLWCNNEKLGLGIADPSQHTVLDDIRFHTELIPKPILVEPKKLKCLLQKIIQNSSEVKKSYKKIPFNSKKQDCLVSDSDCYKANTFSKNEGEGDEMHIIKCVNQLLQSAIDRGASDIHLEPHRNHLQVRFRIDGLLYLVITFPLSLLQRIIIRLKIMSQLDIAERRVPQDGRFQIKGKNNTIDCRINTCPTLYGEKLVIRILDSNKMQLEINKLGMNQRQINLFLQSLKCPHGMVLVTGPTGSGKTITLYSALKYLNTSTLNISSIENPIEIVLPGINQININPKLGLNFANVLRAFLRQDPDVIMVGEMRDHETVEIGIRAAQTGHLVLSSLHTNGAVESLLRLANMGIPSYNIVSSIHLIIAQRLARCLCLHCKVEDELPKNVLEELGFNCKEIPTVRLFTARGCTRCTEGYKGRTGIFEMLAISENIKKLILKKNDLISIKLQAQKEGMQPLYTSALEKLKQGEISLLEMKRIIKD